MNQNLVEVINGIPTVSSLAVAESFEKLHKDVLAKIDQTIAQIDSAEKSAQYFIESTYKDASGKANKEVLLTRDGFTLTVMGFTGAKALQWKMTYIEAFNKMESHIAQINSKGNLLLSIYNGGQEAVVAAKELTKLEVEQATTPLLATIAEQQPAVDFTNTITKSCDNILMRDMAKLLCDQHINIGEKKLYKLLREHDVLMCSNDPYQSFVDRGYFFVKEQSYSTPYGEKLNRTTLVTPKGQIWIVSKTKEWLKAS